MINRLPGNGVVNKEAGEAAAVKAAKVAGNRVAIKANAKEAANRIVAAANKGVTREEDRAAAAVRAAKVAEPVKVIGSN
jgi:hypothetical protein